MTAAADLSGAEQILEATRLGLVPSPRASTALVPIWKGLKFQPATGHFVHTARAGGRPARYDVYDCQGRHLQSYDRSADARRHGEPPVTAATPPCPALVAWANSVTRRAT